VSRTSTCHCGASPTTLPGRLQAAGALLLPLAACACDGCARVPEPSAPSPSTVTRADAPAVPAEATTPAVLSRSPHDPGAFTQGLLFANGAFLESTGTYGSSSLRRVDPATGGVLSIVHLPASVFGEGLARLGGELFQLTWREQVCFVYDDATLEKRRELTYEGEGWGLTTDGDRLLVMSDGTAVLRFVDPSSFRQVRSVTVHEGSRQLDQLNELEWVRGEILANVWGLKTVVRIDPRSGQVLGHLDLSGLPEPRHEDPDAVLNGIAYDETGDRLFVTGKLWGSVFEIPRPGR
jgi:glutamine cyclotransferase